MSLVQPAKSQSVSRFISSIFKFYSLFQCFLYYFFFYFFFLIFVFAVRFCCYRIKITIFFYIYMIDGNSAMPVRNIGFIDPNGWKIYLMWLFILFQLFFKKYRIRKHYKLTFYVKFINYFQLIIIGTLKIYS